MNEYDYLVLLTLTYSSCFSFALTEDEVIKRLPKPPKELLFSSKKIKKSLKKLVNQGLVQSDDQYFYLRNQDLTNRKKRIKFMAEKQLKINEFVKLASKIPFIKAVVLTGSTAVNNAKKNDDLDFMIICQNNTLWLSRFLLIILTKLKHKRPHQGQNNAWCFNILLDENDLVIGEERRSLYEAYEILQMVFVFDRDHYQTKFLNANEWLKKYLFFYDNFKFETYNKTMSFSLLNQIFFWLQQGYRLIAFGQEDFSLSPSQAFFNRLTFRAKLFTKLRRRLTDFNM